MNRKHFGKANKLKVYQLGICFHVLYPFIPTVALRQIIGDFFFPNGKVRLKELMCFPQGLMIRKQQSQDGHMALLFVLAHALCPARPHSSEISKPCQ